MGITTQSTFTTYAFIVSNKGEMTMAKLLGTRVVKDILILDWSDKTSTFEFDSKFMTVQIA